MSVRSSETQVEYEKFRAQEHGSCSFCALVTTPTEQVITSYEHMLRIHNRFPYAIWDDVPVAEHLMIIPKRHTLHLVDFTPEERQEYSSILTQAEKDGYSIYHRSQHNPVRTMEHLHTHLFRLAR